MYNNKEINSLIDYINKGEKRIADAKIVLLENTRDFELWHRYSNEESRSHYGSVLGATTELRKVLDKHLDWLKEEEYFGFVVDLDFIVLSYKTLYEEGKIDRDYYNKLKEELMFINFGSMKMSW